MKAKLTLAALLLGLLLMGCARADARPPDTPQAGAAPVSSRVATLRKEARALKTARTQLGKLRARGCFPRWLKPLERGLAAQLDRVERKIAAAAPPLTHERAIKRVEALVAAHGGSVKAFGKTPQGGLTAEIEFMGGNLRDLAQLRGAVKRELVGPGRYARLKSQSVTIRPLPGGDVLTTELYLER